MSQRVECPACAMPFDIPTDEGIDRWSCDCGESWRIDA